MGVALTVVFYASMIGGLATWIAAIRSSGATARWRFVVAAALFAVAGVLGMFSIGTLFLVLAAICLVSASRETRPQADGSSDQASI